jgi:hypothetical protein
MVPWGAALVFFCGPFGFNNHLLANEDKKEKSHYSFELLIRG